jgi:xylan 1,4-beta-xylosidase
VNLLGSVTWAFEFEDQPYFDGFRSLSTNGIAKPVLNVFRMLGMMSGARLRVESTGALPLETVRDRGVRDAADISALATRGDRAVCILVWNYHDDDLPAPDAEVELGVEGLPGDRPNVRHYRVDRQFSNAYEAWKRMGSPQKPTPRQYAELEKAGALQMVGPPQRVSAAGGRFRLTFRLPRQGVSLVTVTW